MLTASNMHTIQGKWN